jgi:8-oxo-dGTP pyrophosphatase MutT (NUDIX family)
MLSSKVTYKNPWMQIREDTIEKLDGSKGIYGVMESRDSVMVVVVNEENEIYLVNTFSYPSHSWNWELPGGGGDNEEFVTASKRELAEETGIIANEWHILGKTRVCNGFMTERMATLLAQDLTFGEKAPADDHDLMNGGRFFTLSQIHEMIGNGKINDGQSMTGLYLFENWQRNNHQKENSNV